MNDTTIVPLPPRARLSAALLPIARALVAALALVALAVLIAGIFLFPAYARAHPADFKLTGAFTEQAMAQAVVQLGWSPLAIPWSLFFRDVINFALYITLGVLLLARGPRTWFGAFVALVFVVTGFSNNFKSAVAAYVPFTGPFLYIVAGMGWQLTFILFYVFPNGRFVPRWTRWLLLPWIGLFVASLLGYSVYNDARGWWAPMLLALTAIGSQVYRYFRRSGRSSARRPNGSSTPWAY